MTQTQPNPGHPLVDDASRGGHIPIARKRTVLANVLRVVSAPGWLCQSMWLFAFDRQLDRLLARKNILEQ
jgi:hypothetical protein